MGHIAKAERTGEDRHKENRRTMWTPKHPPLWTLCPAVPGQNGSGLFGTHCKTVDLLSRTSHQLDLPGYLIDQLCLCSPQAENYLRLWGKMCGDFVVRDTSKNNGWCVAAALQIRKGKESPGNATADERQSNKSSSYPSRIDARWSERARWLRRKERARACTTQRPGLS